MGRSEEDIRADLQRVEDERRRLEQELAAARAKPPPAAGFGSVNPSQTGEAKCE